MRNYLRVLFTCCAISFLTVSCMQVKETEPNADAGVKKISSSADATLPDLKEGSVNLNSYKDKQPLVLFFWTTWCPFCRSELKTLSEKYPEIQNENGELFAVNVGESADKIKDFIGDYPLNLKIILDKDGALAGTFNILGVPTYILMNKKGSVVFQDHYFPQGKYKELISK